MRDLQIYVSGPLTTGGKYATNVRQAIRAGEAIMAYHPRFLPFIPHLFAYWDIASPHPREYWMSMDLGYVERSSALVRLWGDSVGADEEVRRAIDCGIIIEEQETPHDGSLMRALAKLVDQIDLMK